MSAEKALYKILVDKIEQDTLVLPILPEIALKVRQKASEPDVSLNQLSQIITHDASLSLDMLKLANSAAFGGVVKLKSVQQAVARLGLETIKTLVTAIAVKHVFHSDNANITKYSHRLWIETIDLASVAISLLSLYLKEHKQCRLTLDSLTLIALIQNVGVLPILDEAAHHEKLFAHRKFLSHVIEDLASEIGMRIVQAWELPEEYCDIVGNWKDMMFLPQTVEYVDFLRAGAIYCGDITDELMINLLTSDYMDKGILPDKNFMQSEEFTAMVAEIKATFI